MIQGAFTKWDFYFGLAVTLLATRILDFFIIEHVINKLKKWSKPKKRKNNLTHNIYKPLIIKINMEGKEAIKIIAFAGAVVLLIAFGIFMVLMLKALF